jgi:hypothetical protein
METLSVLFAAGFLVPRRAAGTWEGLKNNPTKGRERGGEGKREEGDKGKGLLRQAGALHANSRKG